MERGAGIQVLYLLCGVSILLAALQDAAGLLNLGLFGWYWLVFWVGLGGLITSHELFYMDCTEYYFKFYFTLFGRGIFLLFVDLLLWRGNTWWTIAGIVCIIGAAASFLGPFLGVNDLLPPYCSDKTQVTRTVVISQEMTQQAAMMIHFICVVSGVCVVLVAILEAGYYFGPAGLYGIIQFYYMLMLGAGIILFEFWFPPWLGQFIRFYKYMFGRGVVLILLGAIAAPGNRGTKTSEDIAGVFLFVSALISWACPLFGIWFAPPPLLDGSGSSSSSETSGNVYTRQDSTPASPFDKKSPFETRWDGNTGPPKSPFEA